MWYSAEVKGVKVGPLVIAIDSPPWTEVFQAVGTVGAFSVSLFLLAIEVLSRRRTRDDERRAQARLVSAWVNPPEISDEERKMKYTATGGEIEIVVRNAGDEPIYRVDVQSGAPVVVERELDKDLITIPAYLDHAIPGFSIRSSDGNRHSGIMEIHAYEYIILPHTEKCLIARTSHTLELWRLPRLLLLAEVQFMDAAGRTWRRDSDGALAPQVIRFSDEAGRVWRRSPNGKLREERRLRSRITALVSPFPWPWTRRERRIERYLEKMDRERKRKDLWSKME
jgi:hypothetical protein